MVKAVFALLSATVTDALADPALKWLGADPKNLKVCEGDCDNNAECPGDSSCIERAKGLPAAVTGCTVGDSGSTARLETDYCNNPAAKVATASYALKWLGADPKNLKVCEGDCDNNAECPGDSSCIERAKGLPAAVTGCTVGDSGSTARLETDYCNNPAAKVATATAAPAAAAAAASYALKWLGADPKNLKVCEGDCDNNAECPGDSSCIERAKGLPAAVTGCTVGDSGSTARLETDYCNNPAAKVVAGNKVNSTKSSESSSAAGLHAWPVVARTAVALAISATKSFTLT